MTMISEPEDMLAVDFKLYAAANERRGAPTTSSTSGSATFEVLDD